MKLVPRLRMRGDVPPLPHTPSCRGTYAQYLFYLTIKRGEMMKVRFDLFAYFVGSNDFLNFHDRTPFRLRRCNALT